ncbi:hypothetical protein DFH09DRAFT_1420988 [Mycena vulgaris]|nr:hypothetical protein DFH09DRAFT_1420988 [Mycena vulgaris]
MPASFAPAGSAKLATVAPVVLEMTACPELRTTPPSASLATTPPRPIPKKESPQCHFESLQRLQNNAARARDARRRRVGGTRVCSCVPGELGRRLGARAIAATHGRGGQKIGHRESTQRLPTLWRSRGRRRDGGAVVRPSASAAVESSKDAGQKIESWVARRSSSAAAAYSGGADATLTGTVRACLPPIERMCPFPRAAVCVLDVEEEDIGHIRRRVLA